MVSPGVRARLDRLGARRGRARAPGETTPEYGRVLSRLDPGLSIELHTITQLLDADRFSGHAIADDARGSVDEALDALEERWKRERPDAPVLTQV